MPLQHVLHAIFEMDVFLQGFYRWIFGVPEAVTSQVVPCLGNDLDDLLIDIDADAKEV